MNFTKLGKVSVCRDLGGIGLPYNLWGNRGDSNSQTFSCTWTWIMRAYQFHQYGILILLGFLTHDISPFLRIPYDISYQKLTFQTLTPHLCSHIWSHIWESGYGESIFKIRFIINLLFFHSHTFSIQLIIFWKLNNCFDPFRKSEMGNRL